MKHEVIALFDRRENRLTLSRGFELGSTNRFISWLWRFGVRKGWIKTHLEEVVEYRRIIIDHGKPLPDRIMQGIDAVYQFTGRPPTDVLMGPATFRELMNEPLIRDSDMFSVRYDNLHTSRQSFGVNLVVLPWMEGLLVR